MRFWLTAVFGIVVISGLSAALYVWNPETFAGREEKYRPKPLDPFVGEKLPRFEFDTKLIDVPHVPQLTQGESRFPLRNEGESELQLRLGSKSCTCAAIRIEKDGTVHTRFAKAKELEDRDKQKEREKNPTERDKISDAVSGQGNVNPASVVTLKPGEKADFIIEWDTKDSTGTKQIGGEIFTNDPRSDRKAVTFDVRLQIIPELLTKPGYFSFGQLRSDQKREETMSIYSQAHDDLTLEVASTSTPSLSMVLRPMTDEEKKELDAKSGYVATATILGRLPVGDFNEKVMLKTNLKQQAEFTVGVLGMVDGEIEVHPATAEFGIVTNDKEHTQKVSISTRGFTPEETLAVDEKSITNDFVTATIRRHEDSPQVWIFEAKVKPTEQVGKFANRINLTDSQGEVRVTIGVNGTLVRKN